ncbi:HD domain-containing protein [Rhodococcus sp. C-2]|uniref:HD domain-containing protein n=1 Tax=Rhodococcus sp. C-2 TaxID=3018809 RepID=UPI0022EAD017|nr:HD domain-containing protein [Rhodococcus sp. C-2]MDA3637692.1 HD domain-containing protein [Rhodococcus sp. C-2]
MTITAQELQELSLQEIGASAFCDRLFEYLTLAGQSRYDESVTQLEHGLQCAHLAEQAGFDSAAQIAALLHDIGHLILDEHAGHNDFLEDDLGHEVVGARLLTRWFGAEIGQPVALHVPAKRYLVATDSGYVDGLSEASVRSLEVQGGPMTPDEVDRFICRPYHRLAVDLRRWDDQGKIPDAPTPPLTHWRQAIIELANVGLR